VRNICFTDTSHLILLDILFVLKVKHGTFLPIHRCAFSFNLKYILCRYASRTLRMKLLTWCRVVSLAGLSLPKYFGPISGPHAKLFYNIESNHFFLSWRRFVVFTAVTSVSEVIFLQLIVCKHSCILFLCWD